MQLVTGIAGAAIGFAIAGPAGAAYGFGIGSAVGAGLFGPKPSGPGPGDLKRPQLTLGAQIARIYGRVRRPVHGVWTSSFRATEHSAGGKGAPEGPSSRTYSLDLLGWVADGVNVQAITRVWVNNKVVWTALADSGAASIEASLSNDHFDEVLLLPGTSGQVPWSVYEDAVGAADAPAYFGVASVALDNLQCGSSKQPPFVEVEVASSVLVSTIETPALEVAYTFNYGSTGSVQFGSSNFASPLTVWGETASTSPSRVNVHSWVDPAFLPSTTSISIAGIPPGGTTPFGGTSDTNALVFRVGSTLYGYYGGAAYEYTTAGSDFSLVNTACYVVSGSGIWINTDQGELYRYVRASSGTEAASNLGAGGCRSMVLVGADLYGADITGGDLIQWDPTTLAQTGIWSLAANALGWLCTDGTDVYDFTTTGQMVRFNGTTWDVLINDIGDIAAYLGSGNQSNPVLRDGYIYLSRSGGGTQWSVVRARYLLTSYAPQTVDLADIVTAELSRVPGLEPTDYDVTDLVGVPVTGYTAVGSAHQVLADLGDTYHFDLVPGRPLRFVRRAAATVGSIPFNHTGAGVGEPGQPFAGLLIGNNDESPGVVGLTYPNVNQDHDVDFQSGDRLNTDGPDIRRVQTNVVMTPAEARGRAFSATVMQRSAAKTAAFGISDRYAAAEPGDAYAVTDIDGNSYNLRIKRFTYADGVKDCEWELNDISALVDELDTETDYTEAITVESSGVADWLALDAPLLRTADDNAGYYAAMQVSGDSPGFFYESEDDTTYTERGDFGADAVFGSVTSIAGTLTASGFIDEYASLTVNVGEGELASITRAALLGARTANAILIGAPGRWVAGQYRTATLSSPGVYVLSGLLLGDKGTEQYVASLAAGDTFALLTTAGWRRLDRSPALLGSSFYVKGVALRRPVTSVTGESFTNTGVALKPLSPVQLRKTLDAATGDASYTFNRRTRHETRFGGDLGDACPLGEESERYRVRFYADGTYATVVRETEVTSATFTYTGAQRTTDYGSSSATAYVGIAQLSATVGAGYELQAPA